MYEINSLCKQIIRICKIDELLVSKLLILNLESK